MGRFITTKADFTLRRKHKKGSGVTIYENDYTTINPMPNAMKGEYVIGDSNFVFTSRQGINGQKKHVRNKFVPNPSDNPEERGAWTLDTIIDSGITDETKIRLKPNYTSIKDFACYGSAVKLVQGTINGVITDFPAELWFSQEDFKLYEPKNGYGYSFNDWDDETDTAKDPIVNEKLLYNEYGIDIMSKNLRPESVYNPLRYFTLCGASYNLMIVDGSGNIIGEYPFTGFEVQDTALGRCYNGKEVEVDKIAVIILFFGPKVVFVNVFQDYIGGETYYTYYPGEVVDVTVDGKLEQVLPDGTILVNVSGLLVQVGQEGIIDVFVQGRLVQEGPSEDSGSTSGDTSGSTSGDTSGSTSGDTSGSTSGDTSGSTSGDTSGSTSGDTSGSTSGDTSGSTSGDTSGDTSGETIEVEINIEAILEQLGPEATRLGLRKFGLLSATRALDDSSGGTEDCLSGNSIECLYGAHIRPNSGVVEEYFRTCDDFTAVLLERQSKPIYTSVFETPKETETGYSYDMVAYTWPSIFGGYNPNLTGPYYVYVESLIALSEYYDEFHCDNMWRSLTHEAIKTLDWTYISNTDGDIQDMSTIDTSRVEPITKIYGRQFDDLKRYADAIKSINTVTYNQKSNTPDYTLTDVLDVAGWETKTLKITNDKDVRTETLYSGLTSGFTASDASSEFLRRLKINSRYLFSKKGTREGLDAMLGLLGFNPTEYDIHEFVYIASGNKNRYAKFCKDTRNLPQGNLPAYPLAKDVSTINKYKVNFNQNDPYGDYCGIPVAEIGYFVEDRSTPDGYRDYSYVVPWYSSGKKYDDGLYFQMKGGWGSRKKKRINLDIAPDIKEIQENGPVKIYSETQARLKFAKDFDDLLQEAFSDSHLHDVFYVTDISAIVTDYSKQNGETITDETASHYFVLENEELNQFIGYSQSLSSYGWRNIKNSEISGNTTSAGTLVLYLESIIDDTTGNNPHIGNGEYDDGIAYVNGMSEIFAHSLLNKNFIGISDDTCSEIADYKFDLSKQEDNRKCWFFTDNCVSGFGKNKEKIVLKEVDVTSAKCDDAVFYDPEEALGDDETNNLNSCLSIGSEARPCFKVGSDETYMRNSLVTPFNPETASYGGNGEAAANSIVNVKNLIINFDLNEMGAMSFSGQMVDYIDTIVIPYLTQMIPSTTILSWSINGDNGGGRKKEYVNVIGRLVQNKK